MNSSHLVQNHGFVKALSDYIAEASTRLAAYSNIEMPSSERFENTGLTPGLHTPTLSSANPLDGTPTWTLKMERTTQICATILRLLGEIASTTPGCRALQCHSDALLSSLDRIICVLGESHSMVRFGTRLLAAIEQGEADSALGLSSRPLSVDKPTATNSDEQGHSQPSKTSRIILPAHPVDPAQPPLLTPSGGPMAALSWAVWRDAGVPLPSTVHGCVLPMVHITDRDEQVLFDAAANFMLALSGGGDATTLKAALHAESRTADTEQSDVKGATSSTDFLRGKSAAVVFRHTVLSDFPPEVFLARPECILHLLALVKAVSVKVGGAAAGSHAPVSEVAHSCALACCGALSQWLVSLLDSVLMYGSGMQQRSSQAPTALTTAAVHAAAEFRASLVRTHYAVGNTRPPGAVLTPPPATAATSKEAWHQRFEYPPAQTSGSKQVPGTRSGLSPLGLVAIVAATLGGAAPPLIRGGQTSRETAITVLQLLRQCAQIASQSLPVLLAQLEPEHGAEQRTDLLDTAATTTATLLTVGLQWTPLAPPGGILHSLACQSVHTALRWAVAAGLHQRVSFRSAMAEAEPEHLAGIAAVGGPTGEALRSVAPQFVAAFDAAVTVTNWSNALLHQRTGRHAVATPLHELPTAPPHVQLAALAAIARKGASAFAAALRSLGGAAPWHAVAVLLQGGGVNLLQGGGHSGPTSSTLDLQSNALGGLLLHLQDSIVAALDEDEELRGGVTPAGHPPPHSDLDASNVTADTVASHVSVSPLHMPQLLHLLTALGSSVPAAALAFAAAAGSCAATRSLAVRCMGLLLEASNSLPADLRGALPQWMLAGSSAVAGLPLVSSSPLLLWLPSMRGPLAAMKRGGSHPDAAAAVDAHLHAALEAAPASMYLCVLAAEVFSVHAPVRDAAGGAFREFVMQNAQTLVDAVPSLQQHPGSSHALQSMRAAALGGAAASSSGAVRGVAATSSGACGLHDAAAATRQSLLDRVMHSATGQAATAGTDGGADETVVLAGAEQLLAVASRRLRELTSFPAAGESALEGQEQVRLCRSAQQLHESCIALFGLALSEHTNEHGGSCSTGGILRQACSVLADCAAVLGWAAVSTEGDDATPPAKHEQLLGCWAQALFLLEFGVRCRALVGGASSASIQIPPSAVFATAMGVLSCNVVVSAAALGVLMHPFAAPTEGWKGGIEDARAHLLSQPQCSSAPQPSLRSFFNQEHTAAASKVLGMVDVIASQQTSAHTPPSPDAASAAQALLRGITVCRNHDSFIRAVGIAQVAASSWPDAARHMASVAWWAPPLTRLTDTPPRSALDCSALESALQLLRTLVPHMDATAQADAARALLGPPLEAALAQAHGSTCASGAVLPASDAVYWNAAEYCVDAHYAGGVGLLMAGAPSSTAGAHSPRTTGLAHAVLHVLIALAEHPAACVDDKDTSVLQAVFQEHSSEGGGSVAGSLLQQALQSKAPQLQLDACRAVTAVYGVHGRGLPPQLAAQCTAQLVHIMRQFRAGDSFQGKAPARAACTALRHLLGCQFPYLSNQAPLVAPSILTALCEAGTFPPGASPMGWLARCVTDRDARLRADGWAMVGPLARSGEQPLAHVAAAICGEEGGHGMGGAPQDASAAQRVFACLLRCTLRQGECAAVRCAAGASLAVLCQTQPLQSRAAVALLEAKEGVALRAAAQLLCALDEVCRGGLEGAALPVVSASLPHCAAWSDVCQLPGVEAPPLAPQVAGIAQAEEGKRHDLTSRCVAALVHVRALAGLGADFFAAGSEGGVAARLQGALALGCTAVCSAPAGQHTLTVLGAALVQETWDCLSSMREHGTRVDGSAAGDADFVALSGAGIPCLLLTGGGLVAAADSTAHTPSVVQHGQMVAATIGIARRATVALRESPHQPEECPPQSARALVRLALGISKWMDGQSAHLSVDQVRVACVFLQQLCWCAPRVAVAAAWGDLLPGHCLAALLRSVLQQMMVLSVPTGLADWQEALQACRCDMPSAAQAAHLRTLAEEWFGEQAQQVAATSCDLLRSVGATAASLLTLAINERGRRGGRGDPWWMAPLRDAGGGVVAVAACAGEALAAVASVAANAPRGTHKEQRQAEAAQSRLAAAASSCLHAALLPCCVALALMRPPTTGEVASGAGVAAARGGGGSAPQCLWLLHPLVAALAHAAESLPGALSLAHMATCNARDGSSICAAAACSAMCIAQLIQHPAAREQLMQVPPAGAGSSLLAALLQCAADLTQVAIATSKQQTARVPLEGLQGGALPSQCVALMQSSAATGTQATAAAMVFLPGTPSQLAHLFRPAKAGGWGALQPPPVHWWPQHAEAQTLQVQRIVPATAPFALGAVLAGLGLGMGGPSIAVTAVLKSGIWAHVVGAVASRYTTAPGSHAQMALQPLVQALVLGVAGAASSGGAGAKSVLSHHKALFGCLVPSLHGPLQRCTSHAVASLDKAPSRGQSAVQLLRRQLQAHSHLHSLAASCLELGACLAAHRSAAATLSTVFRELQLACVAAACLQLVKAAIDNGLQHQAASAEAASTALGQLSALLRCSADMRRCARRSPEERIGSARLASGQSSLLLLRHILEQEQGGSAEEGSKNTARRLLLEVSDCCDLLV